MLIDDPLTPVSSRFPLGPPPEYWAECNDEPSRPGTRPFLLRGAVPVVEEEVHPGVAYRYDPERQITLVRAADGREVRLAKHTEPGATKPQTTGYKTDGDPKNPPPEEMGAPDYQDD